MGVTILKELFFKPFGIVIPIPFHGNIVEEAYIKQLKILFDRIEKEKLL